MPTHELLVRVQDNATSQAVKPGEKVSFVGPLGKAEGTVESNEIAGSGFKEGPGRYFHLKFIDKPAWQLEEVHSLQTNKMAVIPVESATWLR